jgi:SAM-dependent methyltransferase
MTDVEAVVQRYYGDRPVLQRIDAALRAAGVDPERPSHRDLWPFDQLHSRGIVATREHAERTGIQASMYVLDLGSGLGGASRYLSAECGCRVAIGLSPNFVEVARVLTARCGLAERIEFRQANALALPFQDGTFDHVWSYAVTMNIGGETAGGGHWSGKPARRRPAFSVFSAGPQNCGLVYQGRYRRSRASESICGLSLSDSPKASLASSRSLLKPSAPARCRWIYQNRGLPTRAFLRKSIA